jgi:hypothetical protein
VSENSPGNWGMIRNKDKKTFGNPLLMFRDLQAAGPETQLFIFIHRFFRKGMILAIIVSYFSKMHEASPKPNLRDLRSQFLKQSQLFCKALESNDANFELKGQVLEDLRRNLKSLLEMINLMEKEELLRK